MEPRLITFFGWPPVTDGQLVGIRVRESEIISVQWVARRDPNDLYQLLVSLRSGDHYFVPDTESGELVKAGWVPPMTQAPKS